MSKFFYQDKETLAKRREHVIFYIQTIKEFNEGQLWWFLKAYDFFCKHPSAYDGATLTQDLDSIKGLELWSMLHDYFYIACNVWANRKYMKVADQILKRTMKRGHHSGVEISWRMFRLAVLRIFYPPYNRIIKGRKMTNRNIAQMELAINDFLI